VKAQAQTSLSFPGDKEETLSEVLSCAVEYRKATLEMDRILRGNQMESGGLRDRRNAARRALFEATEKASN